MSDKRTLGVWIDRHNFYGTEYVTVRPMIRESDTVFPINCMWDRWAPTDNDKIKAQENAAADLNLQGFVEDSHGEFIAFEPGYRDVFVVDLDRATVMAKTLTKILARIKRDEAWERGDKFMAFCKAIGAQWAVVVHGEKPANVRYSNMNWEWMSIERGRHELRRVVDDAKREFAEAHPDKVRAA